MAELDGAPARRGSEPGRGPRRQILTPEGVNLPVDLADRGERLGAVIIDLVFIAGALVVVFIAAMLLPFSREFAGALVVLSSFALRSFYFIFFELRSQGRTPGKKLLGLRVIDRRGGPLRPDAVFARNLMREIELFLPISVFLAVQFNDGGGDWAMFFVLVWVSIFALMPYFNKDRLRVGDIVGGTWVVTAPKSVLLRDISERSTYWRDSKLAEDRFAFTSQQLDAYGIYELQTLENVIRGWGGYARQTQIEVCERIRKKIGWTEEVPAVETRVFLESFYAALRARLEANLLLGERREDKYDSPKRRL